MNKYYVGSGLTSKFSLFSKPKTGLENLFGSLEELPSIKELLIKEEFSLNPSLLPFRKGFAVEVFDIDLKHLNTFISTNATTKIVLSKYLITSADSERDIFKTCWIMYFSLLDVCAAIRAGQKLSKNALEKAEEYVMDSNDAELLFKYKQAMIC